MICIAFIGLSFITEYRSVRRPHDRPMYSCSLRGCKSAWGDSDSMFHHLCGKQLKHQRNYLIHVTKDPLAHSMTKSELLNRYYIIFELRNR